MLTIQNIESELSYAYLHAVASRCGIICESTGRHTDDTGVDAVLRVRGKLISDSVLTQFTVDVQLKASKGVPVEQDGRYSYSLRLKNYDELRSTATGSPQLLVVLVLPPKPEEWLTQSEDCLVARRCAYWLSIRDAPESTNETHQTVYTPRQNVLSTELLLDVMTRFSREEVIDHAP
jgi:hypothetical protein